MGKKKQNTMKVFEELANICEKEQWEYWWRIHWGTVSCQYQLTPEFILFFNNVLEWEYISEFQVLPEPLIRKLWDRVDWYCISKSQELSKTFIAEFIDELVHSELIRRRLITQEEIDNIYASQPKVNIEDIEDTVEI